MGNPTGAERIAAERQRQIEAEGWTPDHDDEHEDESLIWTAVCYAAPDRIFRMEEQGDSITFVDPWADSWSCDWDKRPRDYRDKLRAPTTEERIRMLEKAGALIAAEIDRLLRAAAGTDRESDHE